MRDRTLFWGVNTVLAIVLGVIVVLAWPGLTGHRLNGEPCGHPPASAHGSQGDESDCGIYDEGRPTGAADVRIVPITLHRSEEVNILGLAFSQRP
jgi:hypothetical protein